MLAFTSDLAGVREHVRRQALSFGLAADRVTDLVLAVSEVAANTYHHARSPGVLEIWHDAGEIVCEIRDHGVMTGTAEPGHGLWIVRQVCDRVEFLSSGEGTTVRLHMALRPS
jgi:anti-sigma regulatory factor (Ser/Thr protein kinase)